MTKLFDSLKFQHYWKILCITFVILSCYSNMLFTAGKIAIPLTTHNILLQLWPSVLIGYIFEKNRPPLKYYIYILLALISVYDIVAVVLPYFKITFFTRSIDSLVFLSCIAIWNYSRNDSIIDTIQQIEG